LEARCRIRVDVENPTAGTLLRFNRCWEKEDQCNRCDDEAEMSHLSILSVQ
jgi:hypothetical protein